MKDFNNISNEVEATLKSFDGMEKKETDPFFYTRLKQRLDDSLEVPGIIRWMTFSPVAKPAFIAALIIINVFTAWHYINNNTTYQTDATANNLMQLMSNDTTYTASNEMYLIFNDDE